jgi:hypothetical protein
MVDFTAPYRSIGQSDPYQQGADTLKSMIPLVYRQKELQAKRQMIEQQMAQEQMQIEQERQAKQREIEIKAAESELDRYYESLKTGNQVVADFQAKKLQGMGQQVPLTPEGRAPLDPQASKNFSLENLAAEHAARGDYATAERLMQLNAKGKPGTTVTQSVGGPADPTLNQIATRKAYEEFGKDTPPALAKYAEGSNAARKMLSTIEATRESVKGLETGALVPFMMNVSRWSKAFGIDIDPQLPQKQQADAFFKQVALEFRNPGSGAGMPGALSDQDRIFLEKIAGSLKLEPEAIERLLAIREKLAMRQIEEAAEADRYVQEKGFIGPGFQKHMKEWGEKNKLFKGDEYDTKKVAEMAEMPPATDHSGKTIKDTKTGKRYRSSGSEWVEVK